MCLQVTTLNQLPLLGFIAVFHIQGARIFLLDVSVHTPSRPPVDVPVPSHPLPMPIFESATMRVLWSLKLLKFIYMYNENL